jgi:ATP-binding cassette subfamily C protein
MNDTLAENLRVGRADATDAELWEALDRAQIGDLIRSLPEGLETVAQERGQRFSGGERQRLALARALLRRPKFLVLDEATSALDWENQRFIAEAIAALRGTLTCLIIAHRPSLITSADRVIAMEDGRVIEEGGFAELRSDPKSALARMVEGDRTD